MKLLAQLVHELPMLDLGTPGAVLHLFQCLECLGIGEEIGGIAFILDAADMGDGPVTVPGYDHKPKRGEALIGELFIGGWEEVDDGIAAERLPEFFDRDRVWALQDEFPQIDWFDGRECTRFGGSPRWTGNGPQQVPPPPFEFFGQIGNGLYLPGSPPTADAAGCRIIRQKYENDRADVLGVMSPSPGLERLNAPWSIIEWEGEPGIWAEFTNFATDGTAFIFINRTVKPHGVVWVWNR